jgi:hypothetical protein
VSLEDHAIYHLKFYSFSSTTLGMMEEIIDGKEAEEGGKIESIPKKS